MDTESSRSVSPSFSSASSSTSTNGQLFVDTKKKKKKKKKKKSKESVTYHHEPSLLSHSLFEEDYDLSFTDKTFLLNYYDFFSRTDILVRRRKIPIHNPVPSQPNKILQFLENREKREVKVMGLARISETSSFLRKNGLFPDYRKPKKHNHGSSGSYKISNSKSFVSPSSRKRMKNSRSRRNEFRKSKSSTLLSKYGDIGSNSSSSKHRKRSRSLKRRKKPSFPSKSQSSSSTTNSTSTPNANKSSSSSSSQISFVSSKVVGRSSSKNSKSSSSSVFQRISVRKISTSPSGQQSTTPSNKKSSSSPNLNSPRGRKYSSTSPVNISLMNANNTNIYRRKKKKVGHPKSTPTTPTTPRQKTSSSKKIISSSSSSGKKKKRERTLISSSKKIISFDSLNKSVSVSSSSTTTTQQQQQSPVIIQKKLKDYLLSSQSKNKNDVSSSSSSSESINNLRIQSTKGVETTTTTQMKRRNVLKSRNKRKKKVKIKQQQKKDSDEDNNITNRKDEEEEVMDNFISRIIDELRNEKTFYKNTKQNMISFLRILESSKKHQSKLCDDQNVILMIKEKLLSGYSNNNNNNNFEITSETSNISTSISDVTNRQIFGCKCVLKLGTARVNREKLVGFGIFKILSLLLSSIINNHQYHHSRSRSSSHHHHHHHHHQFSASIGSSSSSVTTTPSGKRKKRRSSNNKRKNKKKGRKRFRSSSSSIKKPSSSSSSGSKKTTTTRGKMYSKSERRVIKEVVGCIYLFTKLRQKKILDSKIIESMIKILIQPDYILQKSALRCLVLMIQIHNNNNNVESSSNQQQQEQQQQTFPTDQVNATLFKLCRLNAFVPLHNLLRVNRSNVQKDALFIFCQLSRYSYSRDEIYRIGTFHSFLWLLRSDHEIIQQYCLQAISQFVPNNNVHIDAMLLKYGLEAIIHFYIESLNPFIIDSSLKIMAHLSEYSRIHLLLLQPSVLKMTFSKLNPPPEKLTNLYLDHFLIEKKKKKKKETEIIEEDNEIIKINLKHQQQTIISEEDEGEEEEESSEDVIEENEEQQQYKLIDDFFKVSLFHSHVMISNLSKFREGQLEFIKSSSSSKNNNNNSNSCGMNHLLKSLKILMYNLKVSKKLYYSKNKKRRRVSNNIYSPIIYENHQTDQEKSQQQQSNNKKKTINGNNNKIREYMNFTEIKLLPKVITRTLANMSGCEDSHPYLIGRGRGSSVVGNNNNNNNGCNLLLNHLIDLSMHYSFNYLFQFLTGVSGGGNDNKKVMVFDTTVMWNVLCCISNCCDSKNYKFQKSILGNKKVMRYITQFFNFKTTSEETEKEEEEETTTTEEEIIVQKIIKNDKKFICRALRCFSSLSKNKKNLEELYSYLPISKLIQINQNVVNSELQLDSIKYITNFCVDQKWHKFIIHGQNNNDNNCLKKIIIRLSFFPLPVFHMEVALSLYHLAQNPQNSHALKENGVISALIRLENDTQHEKVKKICQSVLRILR